jgi:hypothetical protein
MPDARSHPKAVDDEISEQANSRPDYTWSKNAKHERGRLNEKIRQENSIAERESFSV